MKRMLLNHVDAPSWKDQQWERACDVCIKPSDIAPSATRRERATMSLQSKDSIKTFYTLVFAGVSLPLDSSF
jgi:hypothetical protein